MVLPYQNAIFVRSPTKNCVTSRIMIEKALKHIETVRLSLQNDRILAFICLNGLKTSRFNVMTQYFQQILKQPKGPKYFYSCGKDISNSRTRLKVLISSILKAFNLECNIGRLSQWSLILSCSYFTSIYLKCPTLLLYYDWGLCSPHVL